MVTNPEHVDKKLEIKIKNALREVEKKCGQGIIMSFDDKNIKNVESYSSGSFTLDMALGIMGFPKGRVVEIYGPESSGKTSLALGTIAQAQKKGALCAFIDVEHAFDRLYAEKLGVNSKHLIISQPDYGEQALEIIDILVQKGNVDLIILDSVAALVPKVEIDGEMLDQQMGLQARLMSKALRKITAHCSKFGTTVIFINQIRMKIGVVFGSPEVTPGGQALKFFSSVRLDIRRTGYIKDGDKIIGNRIKIKVIKNKMAPPFKIAEMDFMYDQGINTTHEILDIGVKAELIKKSGSWYSYKDTRLGQGKEKSGKFLEKNPKILNEIKSIITKNK